MAQQFSEEWAQLAVLVAMSSLEGRHTQNASVGTFHKPLAHDLQIKCKHAPEDGT
jgi:hypothetical protein